MLTICLAMLEDPSDADKFEQVHEQYHFKMLRLALGMTADEYDAMEVLQTSFVNLARTFHTVSDLSIDRIGAYLFVIVQHEALKFIGRRDEKVVYLDMDLYNYFDEIETPETDLVHREAYTRIVDCIKKLPSAYRDVLSMSIVDELKPAEIAYAMNKPINTVRCAIKRGRKLLREKLKEERIK